VIRLAAIDLEGGDVVQLVGGRPEDVRVRLSDPVGIAARWAAAGFDGLHVVDLDAALGSGSNFDVIAEILGASVSPATIGRPPGDPARPLGRPAGNADGRATGRAAEVSGAVERERLPVQVGGGVRDTETIERLLALGAVRVIVGTRAVEDAGWRAEVVAAFPGRLVLAADTRDGVVLTRGWTASSGQCLLDFITRRDSEPWAALLVTDVSREGRMNGIDAALFASVVGATRHPVQAAGGIRDEADLSALAAAGVAAAVLGMSIYAGGLSPEGSRVSRSLGVR
jgi:phosphoribosylformimino-5-aminoimidazole carboxamide ribonucleotide (ProFAR) isomerase